LVATSLPELGTVGYELNLFLQDYIGKTGTLLTLFWTYHLCYFLNLNCLRKIQSFSFSKTQKEKLKVWFNGAPIQEAPIIWKVCHKKKRIGSTP
jgi:S-DNA-T family DNA segregation ATPase FtsK/SpoIIIE